MGCGIAAHRPDADNRDFLAHEQSPGISFRSARELTSLIVAPYGTTAQLVRRGARPPLRDRSQSLPGATSACQNLADSDRPEPPKIDPDIELPRLRLQPSVTMAVQVDPALAHAAPGAERVMAEHERYAVGGDLGVGLHAFPTLQLRRRRRIVVAGQEVLAAVKAIEEINNHRRSLANGE